MADPIAEAEAENNAQEAYDASDPKAVNKARQRAGRKKVGELEVVRTLMSTVQGRAWMYNILSRCSVFSTPFRPGRDGTTEFNAGMQAVGHMLQEDIMKAAPDMYMRMCKEGGAQQA